MLGSLLLLCPVLLQEEVTPSGAEKRGAQPTSRSGRREKDTPAKPSKSTAQPHDATKVAKKSVSAASAPAPAVSSTVPAAGGVPMVTTTTGSKGVSASL